jgi:GC-rich sequence DNA-binding factor
VLAVFQGTVTETADLVQKHKSAALASGATAFNPESIPARTRFLNRRTKLLRNLLKWRKYTGERFGITAIMNRLVDGCMTDIARGGWDGGQMFIEEVCP